MTWEQVGAIAGIASFVLTFVLHWDRLRGLSINRILVPGLVGIVVFVLFNQIGPMVFGAPTNIPLINPQPTRSPAEVDAVTEVNVTSNDQPARDSDPQCQTDVYVRENMRIGGTKTYVRCPVGEVQYSIQVDDIIQSFLLQCPGENQKEIQHWLNEERSRGEMLRAYDSERLQVKDGCQVLLTIATNDGDKIGYTVWQEKIGPLSANTVSESGASESTTLAKYEDLGLWEFGKPRRPLPDPAGLGQVIVAHGDIDNSGTCHIKEFGPGEPMQGLGNGTFRLVRLTGTHEQIEAQEARIQQAAARDSGGPCTWLP